MTGVTGGMMECPALWPLIARRAAATPGALFALDERGRRLDFAGYHEACLRVAAKLAALGIGANSVVSWQLPTRLEALLLCGALARLGAVQNPVLPALRERELGFITRQLGSQVLFVPKMFRGFDFETLARSVAARTAGLEVQILADDGAAASDFFASLPDGDPAQLPPPPTESTGAAAPVRWIFYSSGTTADPKGVRHSDFSVAGPARAMAQAFALRADDRHGFVFPLTHIGGVNWLFAGLMVGFAHLLVETFDATQSIAWLRRHGVTLAGAGAVFHRAYLAAPPIASVRCYPGGGAPKPPALYHELRAASGAPIVSGYGLTEYPIATLGQLGDPDAKLAECEGRPTRGCELRITRPDGRTAAAGEAGEIRLRGPHLMRGYVDPVLDAAAFDAQGFLRTGDLGALDDEGYLRVTGRSKDVIIRKGENISASEVEAQLQQHPRVSDVAVIGLPDSERGERVCAVVTPAQAGQALGFEEMVAFLIKRGLMRQKIPERLEYLPELPRNASGKVLKRELQQRFGADG